MMKSVRWLSALICIACSASPKINVGNEADGSVAGSGGSSGFGGFGGNGNALTAKVTEPPSEMAIEVVTISCAGECKQVLAIASGGNPGYTFAWNDGVTTAAREICVDDDTSFTVTVSDTAFIDDEFQYEAQNTTASVVARVLTCPSDGGVSDGGACANDNFDATPDSGHYEGMGTYVCTDGSAPVPNLSITFDFDIDPTRMEQTGSVFFQWGLVVIAAHGGLIGTIDCANGALHATLTDGIWGLPGAMPMTVVPTGNLNGELVALQSETPGGIEGTLHWISTSFDGSRSNDCTITYTATRITQ